MNNLHPEENKFHKGNGEDGKHYWLTPPEVMETLQMEFAFDFDPCPCPLPEGFDGLTCEWGQSNYVNPPFGSIVHQGRKKGMTAWVRKALAEHAKGKRVVMVYPIDKWILMLLKAGAQVRNLGDVRWLATEDGTPGKGTGRHIACFVLDNHETVDLSKDSEWIVELRPGLWVSHGTVLDDVPKTAKRENARVFTNWIQARMAASNAATHGGFAEARVCTSNPTGQPRTASVRSVAPGCSLEDSHG
jgi:hypothetical protein